MAFDERFDVHLYDVDSCRRARDAGLRVGSWPIGLTHPNAGAFNSIAWRRNDDGDRAKRRESRRAIDPRGGAMLD